MRRILVVEDDEAISKLICMNLNVAGYETVPVFDGAAAKAALASGGAFDLALLDIMLPQADGFSLLDRSTRAAFPSLSHCEKRFGSKLRGLTEGRRIISSAFEDS
jgi:DNA-binding response OmpR family regulator